MQRRSKTEGHGTYKALAPSIQFRYLPDKLDADNDNNEVYSLQHSDHAGRYCNYDLFYRDANYLE
jgi:hypothetical protein